MNWLIFWAAFCGNSSSQENFSFRAEEGGVYFSRRAAEGTLLEQEIKDRSRISPQVASCYKNYPPGISLLIMINGCCDKKPYNCDAQYRQYLEQTESRLINQLRFIDLYCLGGLYPRELLCAPSYRLYLEEKLNSL